MHTLELTKEELVVLKAMVEQEAEAYGNADETVLSLVSKVRSLYHRRIPR